MRRHNQRDGSRRRMTVTDRLAPASQPRAHPCLRSSRRLWLPTIVAGPRGARPRGRRTARAGVTSEEVEQAIREGVKLPQGTQQQADGSWPEAEAQVHSTGTTSLVTLALLTAGEKTDSPTIQQSLDVPPRLRPAAAPQHLRHRAADHGLRRRRARDATGCGSSPTSTGWSAPRSSPATGALAGNLDLYGAQGTGRRQLQHPVRPAGPERRQRGRHAGQARGLGPVAALLRAASRIATAAGATRPATSQSTAQHDLRRASPA